MKYFLFLGMVLAVGPALAHEGVHITPHGSEWMPVFFGLSIIAVAGVTAIAKRKRMASGARK